MSQEEQKDNTRKSPSFMDYVVIAGVLIALASLLFSVYSRKSDKELSVDWDFYVLSHDKGVITVTVNNKGTKSVKVEGILVCLPSMFVVYDTRKRDPVPVTNTSKMGRMDTMVDSVISGLYYAKESSSTYLIQCVNESYDYINSPKHINGDTEVKPHSIRDIEFGLVDIFRLRGTKVEVNSSPAFSGEGQCGFVLITNEGKRSRVYECDYRHSLSKLRGLYNYHYPLLDDDYEQQDLTGKFRESIQKAKKPAVRE